ncbi:NADPH-dependent F420 reductase [Amycolatopsis sp. YIM 10]|uniref:NADPH-dependent F420 reductase n=1 Tax=Amycolatopsis sp. YIM 10 TaxID=2653857 RepID=UPI001290541D|nr:NADP oxidoreductase coenzyme F420-dependent [Amycolatopsis sp. YIM 10]
MKIGILGAGNMADALGTQWARAGHEVRTGGRAPAGAFAEAAKFGEVVLLAVRHEGVEQTLRAAGTALAGKVVIDCTNPMVDGELVTGATSAAQRVARLSGGRVVKAFNLCHEDVWRMTPPAFDGEPLVVPLCGDDPAALATVDSLVRDLGCVPAAGGGLARAGLLEAAAALVIGLWRGGADARGILPPLAYAQGDPDQQAQNDQQAQKGRPIEGSPIAESTASAQNTIIR